MRYLILSLLFVILITTNNSAQITDYNLKNLDNVNVQIMDNGLLSRKVSQKLETEIKLKLMSAGIKVVSEEEAKAILLIECDAIESNFAEHRLITMLSVSEKVITEREKKPETEALTYFDYSFYTSKDIEGATYDKVMDVMLIKFIELYLSTK